MSTHRFPPYDLITKVAVATLVLLGAVSLPALADTNLAGEWLFNEGSGALAGDSSGNGNIATLNGGAGWTKGYANTPGLSLNGATTYVSVPPSSSLNGSGSITVAFWINPQATTWDPRILAKRSSWEIKLNGLRPQFSANGKYGVLTSRLATGQWQHVAFTFANGSLKGYVDGYPQPLLANTFTPGLTLPASRYGITIGADPTPAYFAKGALDNVVIYNRALSDSDVLALYLNTLPNASAPSTGHVLYVSPGGSDGRSCVEARNISTPKRTINNAAGCLAPGDTLLVRAGVYAENIDDTIPSGISWSKPVTVAAYPDEHVVIQPSGGQFVFQSTRGSYIILNGLIFDGRNVRYDAVEITYGAGSAYAHHIRVKNSEIRNAPHSGVGIHQGVSAHRTDYNEFINVSVHDNGTTDLHHGFYVESSYNLIDDANVYNNSGWGLQAYTGVKGWPIDGNIVRNSTFHDNARSGTRGVGIGLYNGVGNIAYNNVVYNNSGGITINYGARGTLVYNNTVYNNNRGVNHYGIYNGNDTDDGRAASIDAQIYNNICYDNSRDFENARFDASLASNLDGIDPDFVDASAGDFHLQADSPAIGAGTNAVLPLVTADKDGNAIPKGAAYDIGAYGYY
jgi:parallel beta-helix repeat protein